MKRIFSWWSGAACAAFPVSGFAQDAAPASSVLGAADGMTWAQIIEAGGFLIYVLAGMSVVGLALVLYFVMVLRREQILPAGLFADLSVQLRKGDFGAAEKTCESRPCALSSIALAAIRHKLRVGTTEIGLLRETMEGEGGRQATLMQNQTQYLLDIAIIAPMIGLLGTVMGMLRAFNSVALDLARARPLELAEGVAQALVTTIAGLLVAIPAMVAYAYFRGRTSRLITELEGAAADLAAEMQEHAR
ncbi:MAG TPA: MotA/TolQ/ExbB proton channel family protein [Kiritimatiellia bacterium]|nr:MotA/TolQ/ExbB proton channel family protein [Kiritimatiellia bacterium]HMO99655.1 MotA/TolQ/ExbB proton channel family protein [Kiritimatiellia bacterium]HMP96171.1 MotA/TolQ/ExbB proton channel family protein [Kiritimatiellia bacterium]